MIHIKLVSGKWGVIGAPNVNEIGDLVTAYNFVSRLNDKQHRTSHDQQIVELKAEDFEQPHIEVFTGSSLQEQVYRQCIQQKIDSYKGPDRFGDTRSRRIGGGDTFANSIYQEPEDEFDPCWGMSESEFFGGDIGDKG